MKSQNPFVVATLTFLIFAAFFFVVRFWSGLPADIQNFLCKPEDCTVQGWASASAGWVGFIAALIGAWLVFGQLKEQQKQTAFLTGDGTPTLESVRAGQAETSGRLRVINWNRRTLVFRSFDLSSEKSLPGLKAVRFLGNVDGAVLDWTIPVTSGRLEMSPALHGWIDRNKPPIFYDLEPIFAEDTHELVKASRQMRARVTVTVRFPGTNGESLLSIEPTLAEIFSNRIVDEMYHTHLRDR